MTERATVAIDIPQPLILTANQRLHHHARARKTAHLRSLAHFIAGKDETPKYDRAHIVVTVTWPDRRRRDVHNIMPTVKAFIDGLVDAGVLPDDDDAHLIGPDLRVAPETGQRGVVKFSIHITPLEATE